MEYAKPDLGKRIIAVVIDSLLATAVGLIPVIGSIIGLVYMLTRDSILFEITKDDQWKNRSVGKRMMNLEVVTTDGNDIDIMTSVKRNVTLSIGSLFSIIPIIGWLIGAFLGFIIGVIELILVLTNEKGHRIGDKIGKTQVVASDQVDIAAQG